MNLTLLTLVFAAFVTVTTIYATLARWTRYRAGRSIMWLLCALTLATGYWLAARYVPPHVRPWISNTTGVLLVLSAVEVGRVIITEQLHGRRTRLHHKQ